MLKEKYLVKLVRDGNPYYSEWDNLADAGNYCKRVKIGAECTIYKAIAHYDKYMTLREYIEEHENGAYHTFVFNVGGINVRVININEFEMYYNKDLLDRFNVVADNEKSYGDNCENYSCEHNLTLEMISADKWKK